MTHYGIMTDYEYSSTHKRQRLTVWSGSFCESLEGEALSLPSGGFVVTAYNGDKVRVSCPSPRTDANYMEVDAAIGDAMRAYETTRGSVSLNA